jgi:hypothetical protein
VDGHGCGWTEANRRDRWLWRRQKAIMDGWMDMAVDGQRPTEGTEANRRDRGKQKGQRQTEGTEANRRDRGKQKGQRNVEGTEGRRGDRGT